jgi:hypothetical protein
MEADSKLWIGVLLYGLIRSDKMLERTAQSLEKAIFRALGNQSRIFAHAYCSQPALCSYSATTASLQNLSSKLVSLSLTTSSSVEDVALSREKPPDGCRPHQKFGSTWPNYLASLWSLRKALEASETAVPRMDVLLTVRVDVEFLPLAPITDIWLHRPWAQPDRLFVPDWQHRKGGFSFTEPKARAHAEPLRPHYQGSMIASHTARAPGCATTVRLGGGASFRHREAAAKLTHRCLTRLPRRGIFARGADTLHA